MYRFKKGDKFKLKKDYRGIRFVGGMVLTVTESGHFGFRVVNQDGIAAIDNPNWWNQWIEEYYPGGEMSSGLNAFEDLIDV